MKKTAILLFALVLIVSMLTGCRGKQNGEPGDPTVNNSATSAPSTTVGTLPTNRVTQPTTNPTQHTAGTDNPTTTEQIPTDTNSGPMESTNNSSIGRNRMITGR